MTTASWAQSYYAPYGHPYHHYGRYYGYGPYYNDLNYNNYYSHPRGGPGEAGSS